MYIEAEKVRLEKRERVQGGDGYVLIDQLLEGENLPENADMFAICTLEQGCEIGKHFHKGDTEFYYCLSGEGELNDNGTKRTLLPGDVTRCMDGEYHAIINRHAQPLKFLVAIIAS
ncbi:MAG: cupin domain-containing protein [Christensenellaceae bacterium]|jgi:quercetin dioxygenase-like cupin family protein